MNICTHRYYIFCAVLSFTAGVWGQSPAAGTYELLDVGTQPTVVSEDQDFELVFSGYNLPPTEATEYTVDGDTILVSVPFSLCYSAGNPPHPPNDSPSVTAVPISGLSAGNYRVAGDFGKDCHGQFASIESEVVVYPNSQTVKFNHESPADGQIVSGVGVVRGWACYPETKGQIGKVTFTIDDYDFHVPLPHGSMRQDTLEVCGYDQGEIASTGYGGVIYWPTIAGGGNHTLTIYIDGEEVDSVVFTAVMPPPTSVSEDIGFRKGAEGEYILEEFLGTQESVTIQWSESDQNFIIVEYD